MPTRRTPSTASKASARPVSQNPEPTPADIAARAYLLFQERGGAHGHDWDDWLQAEKDLLSTRPGKATAASR